MDAVAWDLSTPQEDELAYLPEGGSNPFHESMLFPRTAPLDHAAFVRHASDARTRDITLRFFRKLTFVHGRRLVVKSPGHLFRLPMLRTLFPRSRVAFIVRDPHEVVPSMEQMKAAFRRHMSLQGPHRVDHAATARFLAVYDSVMTAQRRELPDTDHALVRYEDLVRHPVATVQRLYERLGLTVSQEYERALAARAEAARAHVPNQFAALPALSALVRAECAEALERYGYARPSRA
jgi:hypothetical protein